MEDPYKILRKKKKKINSKTKGNKFENDIAKLFNQRFNTTEFCRTPGSGAFATTHNLPEHMKVFGDLITPKNFKFLIECKKGYSKVAVGDLFNENCELWEFIKQSEKDAKIKGLDSIIIWKQDRKDTLVILKDSLIYNININKILLYNNYTIVKLDDLIKLNDYFWFL